MMPEHSRDLLGWAWRRSYAGLSAIGIFSIFINLLKLATPIYLLQLLDRVIASRSHETLIMLTVITLLAIFTGILLEITRRQMFVRWGIWIERILGPTLFTYGFSKQSGHSPKTAKMLRDVNSMRSFVSGKGVVAWLDVAWCPLFIALIFLIAPPLGYIVLIGVIVTVVLGWMNELVTRESRDAAYMARREDREWVSSAERHQETIGSLGMAASLAERWSRSAFSRLDEGVRTRTANIYFESTMRFVGRCVRIGVLGVGVWMVIDEVLTLGAVFAANVLGRMAYSLAERAMQKWREMSTAITAYQRIKNSLGQDGTRPLSEPESDTPLTLAIDKVSYRYPNQPLSIFRGIDIVVNPGEVLCVIGPSAAGKTTFVRLVSGLIASRSGKIRLGDVDVYRLQQEFSSKRYVGHLPQYVGLFQGTVRENIAGMMDGDIDSVVAAAKLVKIHDTILTLPHGYDTEISEDEPLLSAGQRKKIALARAFYGEPPLIVLDEPSPHLDNSSRSALRAAILALKAKGSVIVVTTQTKSLSRIADKVLLFTDSKYKVLQTAEEIAALRARKTGRQRDDKQKVKLNNKGGKERQQKHRTNSKSSNTDIKSNNKDSRIIHLKQ